MWIQCLVKVVNKAEKGVSAAGNDYMRQDLVLEYYECDKKGNLIVNNDSSYLTSKLQVTALNKTVEKIDFIEIKPGSRVFADVRFNTRSYNRNDNRTVVSTNITLADIEMLPDQ